MNIHLKYINLQCIYKDLDRRTMVAITNIIRTSVDWFTFIYIFLSSTWSAISILSSVALISFPYDDAIRDETCSSVQRDIVK
jgi:hypothetical protein